MISTGFDLSGRTVLVTGASSGLGAHFAKMAARSGARVVLAARRTELLDDVRGDIETAGGRALSVAMDVSDEGSTRAAYDAAEDAFGPVDGVIANAGINCEGPVFDLASEVVSRVLSVNVLGVFLTVREGARRMMDGAANGKRGRIIIISSITADAVGPGLSVYSASKAAALQLGRVLAREWINKGVNVNIVCPGYIETDLNSDWFQSDRGKRQIQSWPRKRLMEPSSLDGTVLYLLSDGSEYVTGSVFRIDDGQTL
jgi:NAD(P)-dependent dehydrogenase (short-subunit alcohol dehydrogenase family)